MQISLIHLSDIHISNRDDAINQRIASIAAAATSVGNPQAIFIVVSGDLSFGGSQEEFSVAETFLLELDEHITRRCPQCEVNFVMVPGNHDCVLLPEDSVRDTLIKSIKEDPSNLNDEKILNHCISVQNNFFQLAKFLTNNLISSPYFVETQVFLINNYRVGFNYINSAWVSQLREKQGEMVFPTHKLQEAADIDADIVITLIHHPYQWFRNETGREIKQWVENRSDIVLTGHEHVADKYTKVKAQVNINEYIEAGVLFDSNDPENSSFSVLLIDLEKQLQQISTFHWSEERYVRDDALALDWTPLHLNQKHKSGGFNHKPTFIAELEDLGAKFISSHGVLKHSDIYTYPHLQEIKHFGNGKGRFNASTLLDINHKDNIVIIEGADKSGKTSLGKQLILDLKRRGVVTIFIDGTNIDDVDKIDRVIQKSFKNQYENSLEAYWQLPKEERAVIIDDLHLAKLNVAGRNKLIQHIQVQFGIIIVLAKTFTVLLEDVIFDEHTNLLKSSSAYRLLEFGYELRGTLVQKWIRPEDDYMTDAITLDNRVRKSQELVDTVLGRNFIPSYPFFVLTVLQLMQAQIPIDVSSTMYGQGYFYEALILQQLRQINKALDPDTTFAYLANLAYYLYNNQKRFVEGTEINIFHETYCKTYRRKLDLNATLNEFQAASILKVSPEGIRFKYGFMYCYFVGRYLSEALADRETQNEAQDDVNDLTNTIYREESANILLFLTHLSKDNYIIDTMVYQAKNLYAANTPARFDSDITFLNELLDQVPNLSYSNQTPKMVRQQIARDVDALSNLTGEEEEVEIDDSEILILELNKAQKTIQILGQVLKNSPGSIKGSRKIEIARVIYDLGLRVISGFHDLLANHLTGLVNNLTKQIKSKNPDVLEADIHRDVQRLMFTLIKYFSYGMLKSVTHAVGSEKLIEIYEEIRVEGNTNAVNLIDLAIHLDHLSGYPFDRLQFLQNTLKEEKNLFGQSLLQSLVLANLRIFSHPTSTKQKACSIVGVEYKQQSPSRTLPKAAQR